MMFSPYREVWQRRTFIDFMARRDQRAQVSDRALGFLWDILTPAANMAIYYLLIVVIFARGGDYGVSPALVIIVGISHYLFFQKFVMNASQSVFGNEGILMQVKIEPMVFMAVDFRKALQDFLIYFLLMAALYAWMMPAASANLVWYPVLLLPYFLFAWSVGLLLASASVYMRDLTNLTPIVLRILLYASLVLYPISFIPERLYPFFFANPLAVWFGLLQWCLYDMPAPPQTAILAALGTLVVTFLFAHWLYAALRRGFTRAF